MEICDTRPIHGGVVYRLPRSRDRSFNSRPNQALVLNPWETLGAFSRVVPLQIHDHQHF